MSDNDNTATPVKGTINKDTYTEEEEEECEEWLDTVKEQQNDDEPIVFDAKAFTTYVRFKRKQYNCEDINDGELAEIFHNDFKVFTAAQFAKIHQIDARKLRMVLRTRGVYIPKTRVEASTVLYEQSRKSTTDEEDDDDGDMYGGGGDPDDDGDDDDNNSHRGRRPSWDKRPSKHSNTQSLVSLSKFYTNEEKYGGDDDNFDFKLSIFLRNHTTNNGNDRNGSRDSRNSNFRSNNFRNNSYNKSRHSNSSNQRNQCWICKKEGCRSTKHSKEEQDKQRREYREKIKGGSNNAFNKRYDQWMIEYEGEATDAESDSETEMGLFFADLDIEDDADEAFFVSSEPISGQEVFNQLSINTILHTMTRDPVEATLPTESAVDIFYTSYTSKEFYGICIDTACAGKSTVGIGQYHAWKQICPVTYDPQTAGAANVRFGKGTATSIGSFRVIAPFGDVDFHIVDADIPFLLSLEDMDRLKAFYNNITDQFITPNGQYSVIRRRGHAFLTWKVDMNQLIQELICQNDCYLTTTELQRLHRRFGHPSAQRFHQVLQRAGYDENNDAIKHLTKYCKHCQMHSKSPGRFRFTLPEDTEFNYAIYVDVMYIAGEPVLHIVDEATRYQAARFLDNISAKHTFDTLRECWIDVYIGPPDASFANNTDLSLKLAMLSV
ncbi:hypothetical protein DID88_010219 [Monilinia fructigena]|uniref:GAG-pre-integrase domain-containing protein n=1 Tax=Monilinia fructigena TaxID=38457 RepID=A0A395ILZ9_9HELO|nr:hypothetical protein DID88_010219 [Monilinia fructigena]